MKPTNLYRKTIALLLLCGGFVVLFMIHSCNKDSSSMQKPQKNVMFVGSFLDNHPWTENLRDSFWATLDSSEYNIKSTNVYLDSKNINNPEDRNAILHAYIKAQKEDIDLIVASDVEATLQIVNSPDSALSNIPVICVSENAGKLDIQRKNTKLITADIGFAKTYNVARKMFPTASKLYVWADKTATGNYFLQEAKRQLYPYEKEIDIIYGIDAQSDSAFYDYATAIDPNSIVILATWQQGDNGKFYDPSLFYPQLCRITPAPVFTVVDQFLSQGFIGGYVVSPQNNGHEAAISAIDFFNGKDIFNNNSSYIKPIPIFDATAIRHWHATQNALPYDAIVLHNLVYYFKTNEFSILILLVIVVIGIITGVQFILLRRRYKNLYNRSMRLAIKAKNNEADTNLMAISLESFKAITWLFDFKKNQFEFLNGRKILLMRLADFKSTDSFKTLIHPDDRSRYESVMKEIVDSSANDLITSSFRVNGYGTGVYQWWELRAVKETKYNDLGEPFPVLTGMFINIDRYKFIQEELEEVLKVFETFNQLKNEFLTEAIDEMLPHMNQIIGYADNMATCDDSEMRIDYRNLMEKQNKLVFNMLNDILDVAKLDRLIYNIKYEEFDMSALIDEIFTQYDTDTYPGCEFIIVNPYDNCTVTYNRHLLWHFINTYIADAVEHTATGAIIFTYECVEEGVKISISVSPNAINSQDPKKEFNSEETKKSSRLVLFLSRYIVEKSGGKINFAPHDSNSYNMTIIIPCVTGSCSKSTDPGNLTQSN